ncbi:MAG: PhoH family protein [Candidatus Limiplasma sp.]|nr:PhoH family protein [Candidatus Limiplasma sp.]
MSAEVTASISLESMESCLSLFGANNRNVPLLETELGIDLATRGADLRISGSEANVDLAVQVVEKIKSLVRRNAQIDRTTLRYAISLAKEGELDRLDDIAFEVVAITHRGRPIRCKTLGQYQYVKAIREHELTFALGPAGTGKTYLAMALAVVALRNKEIERIVLTRPAVEAGEKLGFLPGDLNQKVDPYLRPLYDALYDMMGADAYQRLQERGVLEVAPLAYMRGRTLSESFIILDEAQNTTPEQMKMFLTRFGAGSKVVITGDDTQTDLPFGKQSGLLQAAKVLEGIPEIAMIKLTHADVVRHDLVQTVVKAYEAYERAHNGRNTGHDA